LFGFLLFLSGTKILQFMIVKSFEIVRIIGVTTVIFLGYYFYSAQSAQLLHFLSPWLIFLIAGLSGIEGLLFANKSAEAKGYGKGSEYQKQTALFFIAMSIVAVFVYFAEWGVRADLTIVLVFMLSFTFSAINHAYQAIAKGNHTLINVLRPFLTIAMIASLLYPVIALI
jgi:predicted YcjX-like family ATPase